MEEIREIFKDKNFNEETLALIENFINEFDGLFSKYVSKEELIKRIKENLNENIIFTTFEKGQVLGRFYSDEKKIAIAENISGEKLKSVFFHEMIHCITNHEEYVGFTGELDLESRTAIGITEGFTQLVSRIRDRKYGFRSNAYPILTEQTENLAELLGVEKFLEVAFNNPEKLFDLMEKEGFVDSYIDAEEFLEHFDVIWEHEDEIYKGKKGANTAEGKLMAAIFGRRSQGSEVDNSKAQIINIFLGKLRAKRIVTKEDFREIYEKSQKYAKQLDLDGDYKSLEVFFEKVNELEEEGKSREEILGLVPEETREMVELDFKIKDLLSLEPVEILKKLEDQDCNIYEQITDSNFGEYYNARIAQSIFRGLKDDEFSAKLIRELRYGLGTYILENGINLDTLGLEEVELIGNSGLTLNLFEATGDNIRYIATLSSASEMGDFEAFRLCTEEEREKLLEENVDLMPDGVIMVAESGSILQYNGESEYTFIDEYKNTYENYGEVNYHKSYAEDIYDQIRGSARRYSQIYQYRVAYILDKETETMKDLQEKYTQATRGKRKFVPKDIENAAKEITLEDVQKMLEEMTGPQITKEESLEKGIGFDEH